jgi:hypothetical protein
MEDFNHILFNAINIQKHRRNKQNSRIKRLKKESQKKNTYQLFHFEQEFNYKRLCPSWAQIIDFILFREKIKNKKTAMKETHGSTNFSKLIGFTICLIHNSKRVSCTKRKNYHQKGAFLAFVNLPKCIVM